MKGFRRSPQPVTTHETRVSLDAEASYNAAERILQAAKVRAIRSTMQANELASRRLANHFRETIKNAVTE